jgi:hypothetical protein
MNLVIEAMVELLPQEDIGLRPMNVTQFDAILNQAWKENGIAGFHMQDKRLSEAERAVLCHIANRVRGRRMV